MKELAERRLEAAAEAVGLLAQHYGRPAEAHAGTILSAAAWLTGTSLFRAIGYGGHARPGTPVLSDKVNEEGPRITGLFMAELGRTGGQALAGEPILEIPEADRPRAEMLDVQAKFQKDFHGIMKKHGLDFLEGAEAGALACGTLVSQHCGKGKPMEARLGAGIVVLGIVAAAKTEPLPLSA